MEEDYLKNENAFLKAQLKLLDLSQKLSEENACLLNIISDKLSKIRDEIYIRRSVSKEGKGEECENKTLVAIFGTIFFILIGTASWAFAQFIIPILPDWLNICLIVMMTILLYISIRTRIK